jgi:hypothetical protein
MVTTPRPVPSCITISSLSCVCNPEVRSSISIAILKQSVTYNTHISSSHSVPPPSQHQLALVSALPPPASLTAKEKEKDHPTPSPLASAQPSCSPQPLSAAPLPDPPLSTSAPNTTGSESRRRNAEQRAAQLRADPLLAQVEPHRVFCALCRKWVQLRQDSTFCAYPWQQHRSKCVIRQSVLINFLYQLRVTQHSQIYPFFV